MNTCYYGLIKKVGLVLFVFINFRAFSIDIKHGNEELAQELKMFASVASENCHFGKSASFDGNRVLIGLRGKEGVN